MRNPRIAPVRISGDSPQYSEQARRAGVQGVVILELIVEPDGRVSGGRVLKPLPFGLTDAAIEAARSYKYTPGSDGGPPLRTLIQEKVQFKLR